jgi:hypothetical protein
MSIASLAADLPGAEGENDPPSELIPRASCGTPIADQVQHIAAADGNDQLNSNSAQDPAHCDDSDPATIDRCVAGECVYEPVVKCPCADDFAAAVAAYDSRSGASLRNEWEVCSIPRGGVGKYGTLIFKFDALAPMEIGRTTQLHLDASRGNFRRIAYCSASVSADRSTRLGGPFLFGPAIHEKLSDAERSACEALIRTIAGCRE